MFDLWDENFLGFCVAASYADSFNFVGNEILILKFTVKNSWNLNQSWANHEQFYWQPQLVFVHTEKSANDL